MVCAYPFTNKDGETIQMSSLLNVQKIIMSTNMYELIQMCLTENYSKNFCEFVYYCVLELDKRPKTYEALMKRPFYVEHMSKEKSASMMSTLLTTLIDSISKEIENTNLEASLQPLSGEQRDQEVERVRNELTSIAQGLGNEQGTQPFNMAQFKEESADAELATSLNSYPNLYHVIMNAGEIFEKANHPSLNRSEKKFHCEIKKIRDVENLVKIMVEGLKTLIVGPEVVLLNSQDFVIVLAERIKACLEAVNDPAEETIHIAFPIVKQRCIGWIRYDFHSVKKSRTALFRTTHLVDINVVQKYFYFTSEFNFRLNLFEAERSIKKRE